MSGPDTWKLQDAKARFSELVRRARAGAPQHVTLHGKDAVVVVDTARFEVRPKLPAAATLEAFVERSRRFRLDADVDFEQPLPMTLGAPVALDGDEP